jgi:hypothetical protein
MASIRGSGAALREALMGARFAWRLPRHLRRGLGVSEARVTLRRRLERREHAFLAVAAEAVYGHRASPYRPLLEADGCEYGDLVRLVEGDGVEGALRALLRRGST